MPRISVREKEVNDGGWVFEVQVEEKSGSGTDHTVKVSKEYYQKLCGGRIPADDIDITFEIRLEAEEKSMHREAAERRKTAGVLYVRRGFFFVSG